MPGTGAATRLGDVLISISTLRHNFTKFNVLKRKEKRMQKIMTKLLLGATDGVIALVEIVAFMISAIAGSKNSAPPISAIVIACEGVMEVRSFAAAFANSSSAAASAL